MFLRCRWCGSRNQLPLFKAYIQQNSRIRSPFTPVLTVDFRGGLCADPSTDIACMSFVTSTAVDLAGAGVVEGLGADDHGSTSS
jgi:hypothetical protein